MKFIELLDEDVGHIIIRGYLKFKSVVKRKGYVLPGNNNILHGHRGSNDDQTWFNKNNIPIAKWFPEKGEGLVFRSTNDYNEYFYRN